MAEIPEVEQKIVVAWSMKDPEGTAPVRVVAGHARRVGDAWKSLGESLERMADSLDILVDGGAANEEEGE